MSGFVYTSGTGSPGFVIHYFVYPTSVLVSIQVLLAFKSFCDLTSCIYQLWFEFVLFFLTELTTLQTTAANYEKDLLKANKVKFWEIYVHLKYFTPKKSMTRTLAASFNVMVLNTKLSLLMTK